MSELFNDYRNDPTFRPEIVLPNGNISKPPVLVSVLGLLPYGPFLGVGNIIGHVSLGEAHVVELSTQDDEKVQLLHYECQVVVQQSVDAAQTVLSKGQLTVVDARQYLEDFNYHKQIKGSSTRLKWLTALGVDLATDNPD